MGLSDTLRSELTARPASTCALGRLLRTLNDDDRDALEAAIENVRTTRLTVGAPNAHTGFTAAAIQRALVTEGHRMSKDVVERHVGRRCGCVL